MAGGPAAYLDQWFLKAKPVRTSKPKKAEADSGSSFPQTLRKKESDVIKIKNITFKMIEKSTTPIPVSGITPTSNQVGSKYKVVLIEEGMGNLGDVFYYSKEAIESGPVAFEGKKIFADHPSRIEEESRPERSVRDVLGNFQDVKVEVLESGRSRLCGNVVILSGAEYDWARSLMDHAIEYQKQNPESQFIGLSINASGEADEISIQDLKERNIPHDCMPKILLAEKEGVETVNVVSILKDAISCDLVTEAGAGGKVIGFLEKKTGVTVAKAKVVKENLGANPKDGENTPPPPKKEGADATHDTHEPPTHEGDPAAAPKDGAPPAGAHDDADQDKELIQKMIGKYMGEGSDPVSEDEMAMAHEAYQAHKEMGHDDEKSAEKSADMLKCARHVSAKKQESEAKANEAKAKEDEAKKEADAMEANKVKEAYAKLKGENVALKESLRKFEVQLKIDEICEKPGLSKQWTKGFRECCKELSAKSGEEVTRALKFYESTWKALKENSEGHDFSDLGISPEKMIQSPAEGRGSGLSFSDCEID